jgi:MFS transporter, UMF1 family
MSETSTTTVDADERRVPRKQVFGWALWDWATQPFNTVIVTFVFTALYLTSDDFIDPETLAEIGHERAVAQLAAAVGLGATIAGLAVALVAPVLGQIADRTGRRKAWLGWATLLLVACMLALFFVEATPQHFLWGVILVALGAIVSEIAGVNYNAMVVQVSTPRTMGRVSGLGWGLGYVGGIVALLFVVILDGADWFGMDTSNGMAYRLIAVGCAVWTLIFAWPLFVWVPEPPASPIGEPIRIRRAYVVLWHNVKQLWREARPTLWFLIASAVYRDGLAGVFTFGAIIASKAYGFSDKEVIMFGIAANLVAGVSTVIAGRLDDVVGPRLVILWALAIIIVAGLAVAFLHGLGTITFWVGGLTLSAMVGPAQASSRSLLGRLAPQGREAEIFGLYATTGRAASFMSQGAWTLVIALTGATLWGTLGIISIVVVGFVLMLFVRTPADRGAAARPVLGE